MHVALAHVDHRPWPIPARPWVWRQTWHDLLFAHWPIDAKRIRPLVPPGLEIDLFEGQAWIAVVPFRMSGVMRRPFPDLPGISAFLELNVRTYVTAEGKPGVWFFSLDAPKALAVWAARTFFHLPYFKAGMSLQRERGRIEYRSRRLEAEFQGSYRPTSDVYRSSAGSLEHWLTERYCLYAEDPSGRLWRNEVHHAPWPLQRAEAEIGRNTMLQPHDLQVPGPPPHLHFADRLDVVVWSAEPLGQSK